MGMWGWKRPRCLERVLAPENFPTRTTAARTTRSIGLFCFYQTSVTDLFCEALVPGPQQPGRCPVVVVGLVWVEAAK